jgi:hypothetical protein
MANDQELRKYITICRQLRRFTIAIHAHFRWAIGFVIVFLCLFAISWYLERNAVSPSTPLCSTLAAVFASLTASALSFGVAFLYTKEYLLTIREFDSLEGFPMDAYIMGSHRIEVNVQGWDGLLVGRRQSTDEPLLTKRGRVWRQFFDAGGTLVLILPKTASDASVQNTNPTNENLKVIASRNTWDVDKQIDEIESTIKVARRIAGRNGVVEVREAADLIWICSIKFDDRWLLLSPYAKRRHSDPFEVPAFLINLDGYQNTRNWIELLHQRPERPPLSRTLRDLEPPPQNSVSSVDHVPPAGME